MAGRRRGNHEGTITKRADGRWEARITLESGVRKCMYAPTRAEVARKLDQVRRDTERGLPVVGEQQTVEGYLTSWLAAVEPRLRPRSFVRYRAAVQLHLVPALGRMRLAKLSPQQLEAVYAAKLKDGLAPATVQRIHACLHKALADAERLGLVARNAATQARAPRAERSEMCYFTPEQARMLLRAISGDPLEAFYALAINTGMRRGEILALHWADVHLEQGYVEVKYTLQDEKRGVFSFAPPKTEKSRRRVPLNQTAVRVLREHRARQEEQRLFAGTSWREQDLVFTTAVGGPLRGNHILQRHFEPLCKRLGLPRIRLHDLRHTAATLWLTQHIPTEVVSSLLGHSSPSITSDIYMHVTSDMQREAASALDRLFG